MKQEELIELSKKLGFNQKAVENHFQVNPEAAEKQIFDAAKFKGFIDVEQKKK